MIELVLKLLGAGISLWETKEKTKYQDMYLELKRKIYEAENKPDGQKDDALLDNLRFELKLLANSFIYEVGSGGKKPTG